MESTIKIAEDQRPKAETLMVSAAFKEDGSVSVLIVGKQRPNKSTMPDIINAFEGPEADELWRKINQVKYDNTQNTQTTM